MRRAILRLRIVKPTAAIIYFNIQFRGSVHIIPEARGHSLET
jgi:hypothetical protein